MSKQLSLNSANAFFFPGRARRLVLPVTLLAVVAAALAVTYSGQAQEETTNIQIQLFDGQTLEGWETIEADREWWTVADGAISGGSLDKHVPHNTFIATENSYHNFDLTMKIRIQGTEGFINSGIQIRSVRVPNSSEMKGYQVDAGDGWWGKLYDESRRNKVIAEPADQEAVNQSIRKSDWNEYRILAEGPQIRTWINGVAALDFVETDRAIPLEGKIGVQVHGGGHALVEVKDLTIRELPATPNAPTWESTVRREELNRRFPLPIANSPIRTAEEELRGFHVPEGFEVELVAAETDQTGKFIAIAFDTQGRMWTMTAMEYPVDANETPEQSRLLFEQGGRDKILVFDQPFGKEVPPPRVFADGLVIPLGILPYQDGVIAQYGNDIRFYRDTNSDGHADTHEVILTGFGVQDSHLFPHQFTRVPGDWILMAQGLFNYSSVRRPGGEPFQDGRQQIEFHQCKLAKFTPDGSAFELLTAGPNNIWGLTISREGETWLQEANDMGYPIIPYEPGQHYPTGSADRLRPYQPLMPPPLGPPQMGGTGLSGLTLADDRDGWPAPWGLKDAAAEEPRVFYVANPITSRIQIIHAIPDGPRYRYEKQPDFLISEDPRFRPVAIQFGPDGCLYIVDWYNKIISHNEVRRDHPERDKTRGRIWRVRRTDQKHETPVKLAEVPEAELPDHLGADNAKIADLAWQEIIDRGATDLIPRLLEMAANQQLADDQRLGALWAWEGLDKVPTATLKVLATDKNPNLRREAVRVAAAQSRPSEEFHQIAASLVDDPSPTVRSALGDALRHLEQVDPPIVSLMLQLGGEPISGSSWDAYDREFERYLARWAMEIHRDEVARFLESPDGSKSPIENRILGSLAVGGKEAAIGIARLLPELSRPPTQEEIRALASHIAEPAVAGAVQTALEDETSRRPTLRILLNLRTKLELESLRDKIFAATQRLWQDSAPEEDQLLALELIGAFQMKALDESVMATAQSPQHTVALRLAALRALRELGSTQYQPLADLVMAAETTPEIRVAAITALAESPAPAAATALGAILPELNYQDRRAMIDRMANRRSGSLALLSAYDEGDLTPEEFSPEVLGRMRTLLPMDEILAELWQSIAARASDILRLEGGAADYVAQPIVLSGPFTVESWVNLRPGITNQDGILAAPGVLDMNFYNATFRVWIQGINDIVVANRPITPDTWTHVAVTRDQEGKFRIYLNGELSGESGQNHTADYKGLNIGRTIPPTGGTDGSLTQYRIWSIARTEAEIREQFDRVLAEEDLPTELAFYSDGSDWGPLSGNASVHPTLEAPRLLTAEQAQQQAKIFDKYRALAQKPGDLANGKQLFTTKCLVCHQHAAVGGNIGPALDGIGLKDVDAILRNVITPSAAMEGGYRSFQILTTSGKFYSGLFVSEDDRSIVLRQAEIADLKIDKQEIQRAGYTSVSVMPDGLLDALSPEEATDLLNYIQSLKQAPAADE